MAFKPGLSWEFLSADEIEARSVRALRNHVRHVKEASPFYRETLAGVQPEEIFTLQDFECLPLTSKQTLVERTPDFLAVAPDEVVETVVTSGSTGNPLVFSLTSNDLDRLSFNEALSFNSMGVTSADRAQVIVSLDRLFIAGMVWTWALFFRALRSRIAETLGQKRFLIQAGGILAFFTLRSIPEVCGSNFAVDLLVMLPILAYVSLLCRRIAPAARPGPPAWPNGIAR